MNSKSILIASLLFLFLGCSSSRVNYSPFRTPTSQKINLKEIVTVSEAGNFCDSVGPGGACLASWEKANAYCLQHNSHLPSAREYVQFLSQYGIQILSVEEFNKMDGVRELKPEEIKGVPRINGFYKVACKLNPDGTDETFYMNDYFYRRPPGLPGNHKIWTATSPPGHDEAAHVVYDEWGGGGGLPSEHMKSTANAFRCVKNTADTKL